MSQAWRREAPAEPELLLKPHLVAPRLALVQAASSTLNPPPPPTHTSIFQHRVWGASHFPPVSFRSQNTFSSRGLAGGNRSCVSILPEIYIRYFLKILLKLVVIFCYHYDFHDYLIIVQNLKDSLSPVLYCSFCILLLI